MNMLIQLILLIVVPAFAPVKPSQATVFWVSAWQITDVCNVICGQNLYCKICCLGLFYRLTEGLTWFDAEMAFRFIFPLYLVRSSFTSPSPSRPLNLKSQLSKGYVFLSGSDRAPFALSFNTKISWKHSIVKFSSWTLHTTSEDLIKNSWTTMLWMQNEPSRGRRGLDRVLSDKLSRGKATWWTCFLQLL